MNKAVVQGDLSDSLQLSGSLESSLTSTMRSITKQLGIIHDYTRDKVDQTTGSDVRKSMISFQYRHEDVKTTKAFSKITALSCRASGERSWAEQSWRGGCPGCSSGRASAPPQRSSCGGAHGHCG